MRVRFRKEQVKTASTALVQTVFSLEHLNTTGRNTTNDGILKPTLHQLGFGYGIHKLFLRKAQHVNKNIPIVSKAVIGHLVIALRASFSAPR
ncbi:MAG: hypothetical protein K0U40_08995 [Betaproteobacteria bacterium]|nr:hypothetical protein [Betaproteobacteria bacterium]